MQIQFYYDDGSQRKVGDIPFPDMNRPLYLDELWQMAEEAAFEHCQERCWEFCDVICVLPPQELG